MEMHSSLVNRFGQRLETSYIDIESVDDLHGSPIQGVHAFCFCEGKLVIVYSEQKGYWGPPGGGVEPGESVQEATAREILEETNMRVLSQQPIGAFTIFEPEGAKRQVRSFCLVEPICPFTGDPDGDVTEIRLIEPTDYKEYFDWGEVGEHQFQRALEMHAAVLAVEEAGKP